MRRAELICSAQGSYEAQRTSKGRSPGTFGAHPRVSGNGVQVMPYTIDEHRHRFAAWAAARASSVNGCRFSVEQGKAILEASGMNQLLVDPANLPPPHLIDTAHRKWRGAVIDSARGKGLNFSHGIAAKLINVYLKASFVCGGHHSNERVRALHPPIDAVLLNELSARNFGGLREAWNEARRIRWSNFTSQQYETVIMNIRTALGVNTPLWEIEQYWQGFQ